MFTFIVLMTGQETVLLICGIYLCGNPVAFEFDCFTLWNISCQVKVAPRALQCILKVDLHIDKQ